MPLRVELRGSATPSGGVLGPADLDDAADEVGRNGLVGGEADRAAAGEVRRQLVAYCGDDTVGRGEQTEVALVCVVRDEELAAVAPKGRHAVGDRLLCLRGSRSHGGTDCLEASPTLRRNPI